MHSATFEGVASVVRSMEAVLPAECAFADGLVEWADAYVCHRLRTDVALNARRDGADAAAGGTHGASHGVTGGVGARSAAATAALLSRLLHQPAAPLALARGPAVGCRTPHRLTVRSPPGGAGCSGDASAAAPAVMPTPTQNTAAVAAAHASGALPGGFDCCSVGALLRAPYVSVGDMVRAAAARDVPQSFPTSIPELDGLLGGSGLATGRLTELCGPPHSGKSALCRRIIASALVAAWKEQHDSSSSSDSADHDIDGKSKGAAALPSPPHLSVHLLLDASSDARAEATAIVNECVALCRAQGRGKAFTADTGYASESGPAGSVLLGSSGRLAVAACLAPLRVHEVGSVADFFSVVAGIRAIARGVAASFEESRGDADQGSKPDKPSRGSRESCADRETPPAPSFTPPGVRAREQLTSPTTAGQAPRAILVVVDGLYGILAGDEAIDTAAPSPVSVTSSGTTTSHGGSGGAGGHWARMEAKRALQQLLGPVRCSVVPGTAPTLARSAVPGPATAVLITTLAVPARSAPPQAWKAPSSFPHNNSRFGHGGFESVGGGGGFGQVGAVAFDFPRRGLSLRPAGGYSAMLFGHVLVFVADKRAARRSRRGARIGAADSSADGVGEDEALEDDESESDGNESEESDDDGEDDRANSEDGQRYRRRPRMEAGRVGGGLPLVVRCIAARGAVPAKATLTL